jgi:hypothetical protein
LPTLLCFNFFATAQNILNWHRTNGTFGFAPTHTYPEPAEGSRPFAKPKEPFFANAPTFMINLKIK